MLPDIFIRAMIQALDLGYDGLRNNKFDITSKEEEESKHKYSG